MTEQDSATVLIVDDENDIVEIFALGLKDEYNVIKAYSGQEALDKISNDVDVVLLDRRMPEMTGKEVLSEIRERELNVRVAMVTAVDPDFDITEMGFDTYIQKPVDTDELKDVV
ncbi:MAG: response regulator transcription factor, partial [Halobacteriaceae archaeon]